MNASTETVPTFVRLLRRLASGLRGQLVVAIALPLVALLAALALVAVLSFTRMTQTLLEERDTELVQLAAQQVVNYWGESVLLLAQVASAPQVRQGNLEETQRLLAANVALQTRFDELAVTNAQGEIVAAVGAGGILGEQVGTLSFFERTRDLRRPVRSTVYLDSKSRRLISVAVPAFDLWGQFIGCALGIWTAEGARLGTAVQGIRVGETGYAYLVDEDGVILYHPDRELVGANAAGHPSVALVLAGRTGAQTVSERGRITVVGYAPIGFAGLASSLFADESWEGWSLLTIELWDDIVGPAQPYVRLLVALVVLLLTTPLLILALVTGRIVAPLQYLVTQVGRVAAGDFDSQVSITHGPAEVRELGSAFDRMVAQLRQYRRDIQNYVASILNIQEQERKRVARELHDDTAQALVVLGRRLELANDMIPAEHAAALQALRGELEELRNLVDDTLEGVRRFTRDLRPPLLEELGLARSLSILASRTQREQNLEVNMALDGEAFPLSSDLELALYRLAQEAISNVRRHSRAGQVALTLRYAPDEVRLEIMDDGVGFDAPSDPTALMNSGRLGLMGIHERARLFGGRATITSAPGQGTRVVVSIPRSPLASGNRAAAT
ncbi:MAG: cache domain-containing protein [Chloroflexota bacterium]